jgi:uncharacterized membrane protein
MTLLTRTLRHLSTSAWRTRVLFPPTLRTQIEQAIAAAEKRHSGEIRFAIETALPWPALCRGVSARTRAQQLFAHLRVWDTHANNGVLIYVLRADRAVEILADRAISSRVSEAEWQSLCREIETHYRSGQYSRGSLAAVDGVARLLAQHFPPAGSRTNELPNQPVLL